MTGTTARRLLHVAHAATTLALLATGFLIEWPDLRARVVGGYGRQLADIHVWIGWAFAAAPLLAVAAAARPLIADLAQRLGPPDPLTWKKAHVLLTLAAGVLLTATGVVLWWPGDVPVALQDASLEIHIVATWVLALSLPVHLVEARRKMAELVRHHLRGGPPPLFEFTDEEDDSGDA